MYSFQGRYIQVVFIVPKYISSIRTLSKTVVEFSVHTWIPYSLFVQVESSHFEKEKEVKEFVDTNAH